MSAPLFGHSVPRLEDAALVTGRGRFIDDLRPAGCLAATVVRSPHAHATFTKVDATDASKLPGVTAVLTRDDLLRVLQIERLIVGLPSASIKLEVDRPVLAVDEVTYVGEPVAIVIAGSRAEAEDAAELVEVDYTPLPAVSDCRDALAPGAPRAHHRLSHND